MNRYVVTGAAGFIGSHLAESLLAQGHVVLGIDSFTDYYDRSLKEANVASFRRHASFELLDCDVRSLTEAHVDGFSGIFHLAAQAGVRGSWGQSFQTYVDCNLLATQHLFELAARTGIRVVFASSSSVYGNAERFPTSESETPRPVSPYGVTKLACEQLAAAYSDQLALDVVALRYFTVYGPRQRPDMAFSRIARTLARGGTFTVFGDGTQTRDVTYVLDAVSATLLAMSRAPSGAIYNVGGGRQASLLEVMRQFETQARQSLQVEFQAAAPGDVRHTGSDTTRIVRDLDWHATHGLEEGIAAQWRWMLTGK